MQQLECVNPGRTQKGGNQTDQAFVRRNAASRLAELTGQVESIAKEIVAAKQNGHPGVELVQTGRKLQKLLEVCLKECQAAQAPQPPHIVAGLVVPAAASAPSPALNVAAGKAGDSEPGATTPAPIRMKIHHLPPTWSQARFAVWLQRRKVVYTTVEKDTGKPFAIISVQSEQQREQATALIKILSINDVLLNCTAVDAAPPRRQLLQDAVAGSSSCLLEAAPVFEKRPKLPKNAPSNKRALGLPDIRDATADLWRLPYSQQLAVKYGAFSKAMEFITLNVAFALGEVPEDARPGWLKAAMLGGPGHSPCCDAQGILRAPQTLAYRNKSELSVGFDPEKKPMVGYFFGQFKDGFTEVGDPALVPHTSDTAKAWAALLTRFLRSDQSQLKAWDKSKMDTTNRGFWRLIMVREGREATYLPLPGASGPWDKDAAKQATFDTFDYTPFQVDLERQEAGWVVKDPAVQAVLDQPEAAAPPPDSCMVMVEVNDRHCDGTAVQEELKRWAAFARAERPASLPVTSFLVRYHNGCSNMAPDNAPVMVCPGWSGEDVGVRDTLLNLRFHVAPGGFFQGNTPATACLYKLVGDWAAPTPNTLLFDVCCGAGTIGLTLAHRVKRVIGVDVVADSIKAARAAAAANGIANCDFHCGRAETLIEELLRESERSQYDAVVAVLDPPRAGLHKHVLYALLACSAVTRIVYVSCNPQSQASNAQELCMPPAGVKRRHVAQSADPNRPPVEAPRRYVPFEPIRCKAVDMFPATSHVESVLLLERTVG